MIFTEIEYRVTELLRKRPGVGALASLMAFVFPPGFNVNSDMIATAMQFTGLTLSLYIGYLTVRVKQKELRKLDKDYFKHKNDKSE